MILNKFFSGKIRLQVLTKLLINPANAVYLRGLQKDLGVSSNTVRVELKKLSEMQLIVEQSREILTMSSTKTKYYVVNTSHPLFNSLRGLILQYVGLDQIIEQVLIKLGDINGVYLIGDLALGKYSHFVDLVIVGEIDKAYMFQLIEKAETVIFKKIRIVVYSKMEFEEINLQDIGVFVKLM